MGRCVASGHRVQQKWGIVSFSGLILCMPVCTPRRREAQMQQVGGDELKAVKSYFEDEGFKRWDKIYGETDEVNKVQLDIRQGHAQVTLTSVVDRPRSACIAWAGPHPCAAGPTPADGGQGPAVAGRGGRRQGAVRGRLRMRDRVADGAPGPARRGRVGVGHLAEDGGRGAAPVPGGGLRGGLQAGAGAGF